MQRILGIRDRPFLGALSPLARLLDWLSWKYGVLFVVSAGNYVDPIDTGKPWSELEALDPSLLTSVLIQSVAADTRNRRTLSPAEAMNALTVGALHADADLTVRPPATRIDPIPFGYPSLLNGHGPGYRRSIKPDVLLPGGRLQFIRPLTRQSTAFQPVRLDVAPGHEVAAPGDAGHLTCTAKTRGTSNANALLSRSAAFLAAMVAELRRSEGGDALASVPDGVLLKALLAHGARWGTLGTQLKEILRTVENTKKLADQLARLLGFGPLEVTDVAECTATRVTAVGGGTLLADAGAEHRFPLPPSLSGKRGWRRLALTLAWFTPVNPVSHRWRKAHLWFEAPTKSKLKVNRVGPNWQAAQRGTLQHDTFESESASAFVDGDDVVVRVSCREDAPGLDREVPYALAVTLEVADDLAIDVYAEVRERVRQRLQVRMQGPIVTFG